MSDHLRLLCWLCLSLNWTGAVRGEEAAVTPEMARVKVLTYLMEQSRSNVLVRLKGFKEMGPVAIPPLIEVLGHKPSRLSIWYQAAYQKMPVSLRATLDEPKQVRKLRTQAVFVLMKLPLSKEDLQQIASLVQDEDAGVRNSATVILSHKADGQSPELLVGLLTAADDTDFVVRRNAMPGLLKLAHDQPRARQKLEKLLSDSNDTVRIDASDHLLKLNRNHTGAVETLRSELSSPALSYRVLAANRYRQHDSRAKILLPVFMEAIASQDDSIWKLGAEGLADFGAEAQAAVPQLKLIAPKASRYTASMIAIALREIGTGPVE
jgi:HEAT repeat protein